VAAKCSAIVPVYQDPTILDLFLGSFWSSVELPTRLIVVNDGSGGEVGQVLDRWSREPHPLIECNFSTHESPAGAARSRNVALTRTAGDLIFFIDSDVVLLPQWQTTLASAVTVRPSIGCAGAVLLYPQTGGVQHAGIAFSDDVARHLYLNADPRSLPAEPYAIQAVVFALCVIRSTAVERTGLLDETFFNAYEDFDYMFRLRAAGYELVVEPRARAYHWEKTDGPHRGENQKRNLGRFWRRWGACVRPDLAGFIAQTIDKTVSIDGGRTIGVDLCHDRADAAMVWKILAEQGMAFVRIDDCSYRVVNRADIWLPQVLGRDGYRVAERYVFAVNNFVQLLNNRYWGELRRTVRDDDVIVDLYGNASLLSNLVAHAWPGTKIR
jgi:GT2 family glycosyltransferase